MRSLLSDVITEEQDDIWLLRYVLSNKTGKDAEEPARFTIKYRKDNAEMISLLKRGGSVPNCKTIEKYFAAGEHGLTNSGEPIFYVRLGLSNTTALMDSCSYEEIFNYMVLNRELTLINCDKLTRKERRLVKAVTILDFQGFSLTKGNDPRFAKLMGASSKVSEKMFPQLLGRNILLNTPTYM